MLHKPLGTSRVRIPEIGLGTWKYTGGLAPIRRSIELGANLIDTAEIYGSEPMVGDAIAGIREKAFIATKVSGEHLKYDQVLRACDGSLKALRIDVIDLYQVHWPSRDVPVEETMGAMEALVDAGKIRFIGVSNFSVPLLQRARAALKQHPLVSNQIKYNLIDRRVEAEVIPYCAEHNIAVIGFSPLAEGLDHVKSRDAGSILTAVAKSTGKTEAQVALNWCTARPNVVTICKTNSVARVEENCGASGWRLTDAQRAMLTAINHDAEGPLTTLRRAAGDVLRALRLR